MLIREAGPVSVAGQPYRKGWLDREIQRDKRRQGPQDDRRTSPDRKRAAVAVGQVWRRPGRTASTRIVEGPSNKELLESALSQLRRGKMRNVSPLLPALFSLKGKPYRLDNHFPCEPVFNTEVPRRMLYKSARQIAKSTSIAAQGVLRSISIPHFSTMYITPLYETIRRFSSNYVRGFIDQSPIRGLMIDSSCNNSVLQRSFRNHSNMFFSFAYHDADRTRGVPCDANIYDEIQDLNKDHIPVIRETLSASRWKFEQFMGTPKTLENTIELLWQDSSQAQWHIWCGACGRENIPSLEFDIDAMTGPAVVTREVSESAPGVVCARCGRPLNPREGCWVHHRPELRIDFPGYHIPQQIMPMHYADPDAWAVLLGKRAGYGNTAENTYYNEVCGESFDRGAKMLTQTDLKNACDRRPNTLEHAAAMVRSGSYVRRILAVDWSGGGQDRTSFTVMVALGLRSDGRIDVLYAHRFRNLHDYGGEVRAILRVMRRCQCTHVVHDFGGAGAVREHLLVNAGLSIQQLWPVAYVAPRSGPIFMHKPANDDTGQRAYWQCDKARSLVTTCELVKLGQVRFFEYDFKGSSQPGLLHDFLSLLEDVVGSKTGHDITVVIRNELAGPDDFAQATNIGVCALYEMAGQWPDIAALSRLKLDAATLRAISPDNPDWDLN